MAGAPRSRLNLTSRPALPCGRRVRCGALTRRRRELIDQAALERALGPAALLGGCESDRGGVTDSRSRPDPGVITAARYRVRLNARAPGDVMPSARRRCSGAVRRASDVRWIWAMPGVGGHVGMTPNAASAAFTAPRTVHTTPDATMRKLASR